MNFRKILSTVVAILGLMVTLGVSITNKPDIAQAAQSKYSNIAPKTLRGKWYYYSYDEKKRMTWTIKANAAHQRYKQIGKNKYKYASSNPDSKVDVSTHVSTLLVKTTKLNGKKYRIIIRNFHDYGNMYEPKDGFYDGFVNQKVSRKKFLQIFQHAHLSKKIYKLIVEQSTYRK
ncbi:hypothetical protein PT285_09960 [Lactobacillus sp. ESL0791]|uniref:hypothetical protein n=1 Tax=Lactobacillus sp. ESL0791 TaxID=2983234 RepID=UPI0023F7CAAF|nr:hypothetical protein [Lactobacillus sp. ESL0791]MDF7639725.1 hypothetical protein [Lactobacillus sp. ESL0791]